MSAFSQENCAHYSVQCCTFFHDNVNFIVTKIELNFCPSMMRLKTDLFSVFFKAIVLLVILQAVIPQCSQGVVNAMLELPIVSAKDL